MSIQNTAFQKLAEGVRAHSFTPSEPRPIVLDEAQANIVTIIFNAGGEPLTGYEIVRRSGGALNINSVYVQIDKLVALGILHSNYEVTLSGAKPKLPKRFITLSNEGRVDFSTPLKKDSHESRLRQSTIFSDVPGTTTSIPQPV